MTRLPYLDLMRGLAALCVLVFHYSTALHALDPTWAILPIGSLGVRVFFVISGFVIAGSAMRSASRGAFAWARFVRLYPAFLTCMVLTTIWLLALRLVPYQIGPVDWALNLMMVPGWFGAEMVDSVYWTLAYEVAFYSAVCMALPRIKRGAALWLCAASLPVLWWFPLIGWFLIGVVAHEMQGLRFDLPQLWLFQHDCRHGYELSLVSPRSVYRRIDTGLCRQRLSLWLGAVSYPLYLLHCKIGVTLIFILAPPIGLLPAALLSAAAIIALATLVHRMVERPVWRYAGQRRSPIPPARAPKAPLELPGSSSLFKESRVPRTQ